MNGRYSPATRRICFLFRQSVSTFSRRIVTFIAVEVILKSLAINLMTFALLLVAVWLVPARSEAAPSSWAQFDGLRCHDVSATRFHQLINFTCQPGTYACDIEQSTDNPDSVWFNSSKVTPTGVFGKYLLAWGDDEDSAQDGDSYCDDSTCFLHYHSVGGGSDRWYLLSIHLISSTIVRLGSQGTPPHPDYSTDYSCTR